jgi:ankyrin repeat protein
MKIKKFKDKPTVEEIDEWMTAAGDNDLRTIKKMITQGFPPDFCDGWSALSWAGKHGNIDMIDVLIEGGVDVNYLNPGGYTVLMKTAQWGRLEAAQHLVEKYNADLNIVSKEGTALFFAARNGFLDIVQYLLSKGADYTIKQPEWCDYYTKATPRIKKWIEENYPEFVEDRLIKARAETFGI